MHPGEGGIHAVEFYLSRARGLRLHELTCLALTCALDLAPYLLRYVLSFSTCASRASRSLMWASLECLDDGTMGFIGLLLDCCLWVVLWIGGVDPWPLHCVADASVHFGIRSCMLLGWPFVWLLISLVLLLLASISYSHIRVFAIPLCPHPSFSP